MASNVFISAWMVALFFLMLVYVTQGNGCKCGLIGAYKATCPGVDKSSCDKNLVAKNLNQCRRNCAGKRSNIESLLSTGENTGQYRGETMSKVADHDTTNGWTDAIQQNDWTKHNTDSPQCLLDDILHTLPQFWQDYIVEAFEVAMSESQ